jgi:hypothetical protein
MACVDNDKFNLQDHGKDAAVALRQLLLVPGIAKGVLGKIIPEIQNLMTKVKFKFDWIPDNGNNAGSAAGFFKISETNPNGIELERVAVTVMEGKRSQVVHELVHALDMRYYYFNISHPPLEARLAKRVPVLYLNDGGDIWKYGVMDVPFVNNDVLKRHEASLTYFRSLARRNNLLAPWQRTMLMTQLDYAARADKIHVEFTSNVAQCLALIYQWGFTGNEKGLLGNPRSIALLTKKMENELETTLDDWHRYQAPARKPGAVIKFSKEDKRKPDLAGKHFEYDEWWKLLGKERPEDVIPKSNPLQSQSRPYRSTG